MDRKLAAILATDVVGYSRLMGEDEAGTLNALKAHRADFTDPLIAAHRGRVVKLMGDGALVEFASVVDALRCAVAIQRGMAERNADVSPKRRIEFRMGINIGDVIVDGDDIYGTGVNVAARLETLAEPGGICLSDRVVEEVRGKVDVGFVGLGPQTVKNIDTLVNAYRVLLDPADAGKMVGAPAPAPEPVDHGRHCSRIGGRDRRDRGMVPIEEAGHGGRVRGEYGVSFAATAVGGGAPFDNLSGDPEQEFLADGLTETIIGTLSQVPDLFVISRNSTFAYKDQAVPVSQVAEEQGVRYVLEGSVQRSDDRIRVTAQLVDALEGHQLWSEQYDREFEDIFDLQDDIAQNIMVALQVELTEGSEVRDVHTRSPSSEAFELFLKSRFHHYRMNREDNAIARDLASRLAEMSPDYADAWEMLGWQTLVAFRLGWTPDRDATFADAMRFAERAYELDPSDAGVNGLLGWLDVYRGRYDEALAFGQKAVELGPGDANALAEYAWILGYAGRPAEAFPLLQRAMRLSPYYPAWFLATLGWVYMLTGDYPNAIAAHEQLIERDSLLLFAYVRLAELYALQGDEKKARFYGAELLKTNPSFNIQDWVMGLPYRFAEDRELERNMLRKAGLPEADH